MFSFTRPGSRFEKCFGNFPPAKLTILFSPEMEMIRETALRELTEETGYSLVAGGELTYLGHYYSSQGFCDETPHLFLARPVQATGFGQKPEESESIVGMPGI